MAAKKKETITVAGVTFSADQVQTATLKIDDREVKIEQKEDDEKSIGFKGNK